MKSKCALVLLALVLVLTSSQTLETFRDVTIQKIERKIDVQTQLCKIETRLEIKNERDSSLNEFYFAIPSESIDTLRLFIVKDNYDSSTPYNYKILNNLKIQNEYNATLYKIELDPPLKPGQSKTLRVSETHWGKMQALPQQISTLVTSFSYHN